MESSSIKRNSEFELLRILCIFMILCLHANKDILYVYHYEINNIIRCFVLLQESLSIVAVNCFVLITGYFSVLSNKFRIRKIFDLIVLTSGYGIIIYLVACLFKIESFDTKTLIKCGLPYCYDKVWFINVYLILIIVVPFINKLLTKLTIREYRAFLVIFIILNSVCPSFLHLSILHDKGYGIISFVMVYAIAGYIRLHITSNNSSAFWLILYLLFSGTVFCCINFRDNGKWLDYNNFFVIGASVSLFMATRSVKIESSKVNFIAKSVIAVYLIHAHQIIRPHVFITMLSLPDSLTSFKFPIIYFGKISMLFSVCIIIDIFRRGLIGWMIKRYFDKIEILNKEFEI